MGGRVDNVKNNGPSLTRTSRSPVVLTGWGMVVVVASLIPIKGSELWCSAESTGPRDGNLPNTVRRYLHDESAWRYKPHPPWAIKVAALKPKEAPAPIVRFETVPGGRCRSIGRLFGAAATGSRCLLRPLSGSRAAYVEFVSNERVKGGNADRGA
jgi:hypothetical protein